MRLAEMNGGHMYLVDSAKGILALLDDATGDRPAPGPGVRPASLSKGAQGSSIASSTEMMGFDS
ncbi:hypothetical protein GCM10009838_40270 [Catenulispora subtropica]|uniref:Uncharacterized protein n=1 Tax=Catenulispora subtropica TaxID=450798 RepID=A0ABN2RW84_9ACTN